uniref:Uncharacterized protein n=2 Tax=Trypanosoma congolense (strain IL3000) TaxID=1068625 RepID=G0UXN6_TRYCI|nr:conserved hypothetical protein [Trypanosoma congolense IL3000]
MKAAEGRLMLSLLPNRQQQRYSGRRVFFRLFSCQGAGAELHSNLITSGAASPFTSHYLSRCFTCSVRHCLSSCSKTSEHPSVDDLEDPVCSFLKTNKPTPLTELARALPDDVIEQLTNGLKAHLESFPTRYQLSRNESGIFHVQKLQCNNTEARTVPFFISLGNVFQFKINEGSTGGGDAVGMSDGDDGARYVERVRKFLRESEIPSEDIQLWMLSSEYAMNGATTVEQSPAVGEDFHVPEESKALVPRKVLQAFCWIQLKDCGMVDEALGNVNSKTCEGGDNHGPSECVQVETSLYLRIASTRALGRLGLRLQGVATQVVEEYNLYRLCRVLTTNSFTNLSTLDSAVGEWLTQPLATVLALGTEERKVNEGGDFHNQSVVIFDYDTKRSSRVVGVRFWLDEKKHLPPLYHDKSHQQLKDELEQLSIITKKELKSLRNEERVRIISRRRLLLRCMALHEYGPSVLCHPDVLAYYMFDLLPADGRLVITGKLPQLLPEAVRRVTDARCRVWLRNYPHLFRLVETPPELCVQRADAGASLRTPERREQQQVCDSPVPSPEQVLNHHERLLHDRQEQLWFMVSLVAARLDASPGKYLLPSHLPKFMSRELRRAIIPKNSGGIVSYLKQHPEVFILQYDVHPHEPVVSLAPDYHPNPSKLGVPLSLAHTPKAGFAEPLQDAGLGASSG